MRWLLTGLLAFLFLPATITAQSHDYTWESPILIQFDDLLPDLHKSVDRISNQTSSVGVMDIVFDGSISKSARQVMKSHILQLLSRHNRLKTVHCDPCNKIRTYIKAGVLYVSRGITEMEYRQELAKELKIQSFLSISVFQTEQKLSIQLTVYDATNGEARVSEILTGQRVKNKYTNFFLGGLTVPVKAVFEETATDSEGQVTTEERLSSNFVDHNAVVVGIERIYRLKKYLQFSASLAFYADTTEDSTDTSKPTLEEDFSGLLLGGDLMVGWCCQTFFGGLIIGFGQMFSEPLQSPTYGKIGFRIGVARSFSLSISQLAFSSEFPDANGGQYITAGWQF